MSPPLLTFPILRNPSYLHVSCYYFCVYEPLNLIGAAYIKVGGGELLEHGQITTTENDSPSPGTITTNSSQGGGGASLPTFVFKGQGLIKFSRLATNSWTQATVSQPPE